MSFALLWLAGPMQSWGAAYNFCVRDTEPFPTKSALLGLAASAMGLFGPQSDWLAKWRGMKLEIDAYDWKTKRRRQAPILVDFQTIGVGFDKSDKRENCHIPRNIHGKPTSTAPKITYRRYLQDAAFACAMEIPEGFEENVGTGLSHPKRDLALGRKCCAPYGPIFRGIFWDSASALEKGDAIAAEEGYGKRFHVRSGLLPDGQHLILNDVPLQFGHHKKYLSRWVTISTFADPLKDAETPDEDCAIDISEDSEEFEWLEE